MEDDGFDPFYEEHVSNEDSTENSGDDEVFLVPTSASSMFSPSSNLTGLPAQNNRSTVDLNAPINAAWKGGSLNCISCERIQANMNIYNCISGHLICGLCVQYPTGYDFESKPRCTFCDENAARNERAENLIAELLIKCKYCEKEFKNSLLKKHETEECEKRILNCKYQDNGCTWQGIKENQTEHETNCEFMNKVVENENVVCGDVESKPRELDLLTLSSLLMQKYVNVTNIRLVRVFNECENESLTYYESPVFYAANMRWYCKAKIEKESQSPSTKEKRILKFALKNKNLTELFNEKRVSFAALGGKFHLQTPIFEHRFSAESDETDFLVIFESEDLAEFKNLDAPITFRLLLSLN